MIIPFIEITDLLPLQAFLNDFGRILVLHKNVNLPQLQENCLFQSDSWQDFESTTPKPQIRAFQAMNLGPGMYAVGTCSWWVGSRKQTTSVCILFENLLIVIKQWGTLFRKVSHQQ